MIDEEALRSIEKLHEMKKAGVISEADFDKAKEGLLAGRSKRKTSAPSNTPVGLPAEADYVGWALLPVRRYAQFEGRSSRKEFWLFQLLFVAGLLPFGLLGVLTGPDVAAVFYLLGVLGLLIPQIAVQVRRFHDQDKPGWLVLLNLIPYLGAIVVLIFMLLDGTPGANRFGEDPKGR
jgi:uncharacterized membrane protein YhaH (DUF805 family)